MPILDITSAQRRELRSAAHHLDPVVMIGQHGLTPAVLHEIDSALRVHQLIKIRVFSDERETRAEIYVEICEKLDAAPVQQLGKLLIIHRPKSKADGRDEPPAKTKVKKEIERPRFSDFPKAPARVKQIPAAQNPAPKPKKMRDEYADNWTPEPKAPRKRPAPALRFSQREETPRPRRIEGDFGGYQSTGNNSPSQLPAPESRRRLRDAAEPTQGAKPAPQVRYRWKDRDQWQQMSERTPRPSTRSTSTQSKRGIARDPKAAAQSRRRLKRV